MDGNCQFHAIAQMLPGQPFTHTELRNFAVQYLEEREEAFRSFFTFHEYPRYLDHMRRDRAWGDGLTLTVLASILMRPIVVVSDGLINRASTWTIEPSHVARQLWESPLVLAYSKDLHYDATRVAGEPAIQSVARANDGLFGCDDALNRVDSGFGGGTGVTGVPIDLTRPVEQVSMSQTSDIAVLDSVSASSSGPMSSTPVVDPVVPLPVGPVAAVPRRLRMSAWNDIIGSSGRFSQ